MNHLSNTFQSITNRLFRPNIMFLVAYILLSAGGCLNENLQRYNDAHQIMPPKDPKEAQDQALGVTYLLGSGKLLDLDGYQCGLFIASKSKASENEEIFMIKLPPKGGWMQLGAQGKPGAQTDVLPVRYDTFEDPRMIKIDRPLLKLLLGETLDQPSDVGQSGCDKEDFLDAIEQDNDRLKVKLFYKTPIEGSPIFTENDLSYSTRFTKKLYQEFNSDHTLIQSTFSIEGSATSPALTNIEKVGFLLVKDKSGLVNWVKNMLEGEVQWGTNAKVATTKDYITCPAELIDGALRCESKDGLQNASFRLEDFSTTCCCLKDGTYGRLISLKNIDIESELISERMQEMLPETAHYKEKPEKVSPPKNEEQTSNSAKKNENTIPILKSPLGINNTNGNVKSRNTSNKDENDEVNFLGIKKINSNLFNEIIKSVANKWSLTQEEIIMIFNPEDMKNMSAFKKINPKNNDQDPNRYRHGKHQKFWDATNTIPEDVVTNIVDYLDPEPEKDCINQQNLINHIKEKMNANIKKIRSDIDDPATYNNDNTENINAYSFITSTPIRKNKKKNNNTKKINTPTTRPRDKKNSPVHKNSYR